MSELSQLPNIGEILEGKIMDVEVKTPEELRLIGSKEVFIRIKMMDDTACYNMLCALEGAVQGIRWHNLSETVKKDLKCFFQSIK
ncbi:TfoX/Sxy family DNA transformation protein [Clostridium sp. CF012]|uniref:TfoX/Sxy family DNA transformation protein n=1 Tax=Clostridium sp. CF012 TaxID=2843319 RepID=UPI001C0B1C20|nr:TfoX/Sxy family DNA transformation protein [Clostridium sp. CF012]MBU3142705.1 TfoX/Sxy family protein [Clostridium sp. CF012]